MSAFSPSLLYPATGHHTLYGVPDGYTSFVLGSLALQYPTRPLIYVCGHEMRATQLAQEIDESSLDIEVLTLPAWDCLPYDRVSPRKDILGQRVQTLTTLLTPVIKPRLLIVTTRGFFQRVPPHTLYQKTSLQISRGQKLDFKALERYLIAHGFNAVTTVREPGEFSRRGGIIDFFPAAHDSPYRLDLFGDEVEDLKVFDPLTQRSLVAQDHLFLTPVNEILLNDQTVAQFRQGYRALFGTMGEQDPLYQAISAHRFYSGAEHWLPLFYKSMETVLNYLNDPLICFDFRALDAAQKRQEQVQDYYQARLQFKTADRNRAGQVYHPLPPEQLYPSLEEMETCLKAVTVFHFSPFSAPSNENLDLGARAIADFSALRHQPDALLIDHFKQRLSQSQSQQKKVIVASLTAKSQLQMAKRLREGDVSVQTLLHWTDSDALSPSHVGLIQKSLPFGFETATTVVITEQDLFGNRQRKSVKRQRRSDLFINEASALNDGDYVVHQEHGVGHFRGLVTLTVANVSHDCVTLMYAGGDKLFLPVENLEILSRYGGESSMATLDKLGSSAWQLRKAKIKQRLQEIAHHLIKLAAERQLHQADRFDCPEELYQNFVSKFPYQETEDQARVIEETLEDLKAGKPMDRLVCGDVGFGKTEVALRAAFTVAVAGQQVAVIVPTTLLCRQHYRNFEERFEGSGLRVHKIHRFVTSVLPMTSVVCFQ